MEYSSSRHEIGRPSLPRSAAIASVFMVAALLLGAACNDPTYPGQGRVRERWFEPQSNGFPNPRPIASGSVVYFASGEGAVIARDVATGKVRWTTEIGSSPHSASREIGGENFVLSNGVLVTAVQFHTSGLDALTGRELWRYEAPLDTIDKTSPRPGFVEMARIDADNSTAYIPAWGATVSAVDLQTGRARWIWRVEPTVPNRSGSYGVQISGDTVFATVWHFLNPSGTRSEAWLIALDKQTGQEYWRVVFPRQASGTMINCAPAAWQNLVIVTLTSGELFAVDRRTQSIAWTVPAKISAAGLGTALITGAVVYGDVVYVNGSDQQLHAYRASDGTQIWESLAEQLRDDPLVTEKFVYANGASLYIVDRLTGARYGAPGHPRKSVNSFYSSPAAAYNGQIFVTLNNGAWSFDEP